MSENVQMKKISIGMENFKRIIDDNGYFVDKTLMIQDIIKSNAMVTLFTRPRRFGKTLNQSMLKYFFEDVIAENGEKVDNSYLFDELAISECGDDVMSHQGKHPVIFLSLKSAKQPDFEIAYKCLIDEIAGEFQRHCYVLTDGSLSKTKKEEFEKICSKKADADSYAKSLKLLSECLSRYHGRNTLILIDEYDVPLENAYFEGFYDEMIAFIRSLFESAFKTNDYLYKGVITGCLRISRESIFTGLNNLEVDTVLHARYGDSFGFTQEEVEKMLLYYNLGAYLDEVKIWYDGYQFGSTEIYNPWSILKYTNDHIDHVAKFPLPYWSNTSSNSIVRSLVHNADAQARKDLEVLMEGGTIRKQVHEDITYDVIDDNEDNLWNLLYFTGYLKSISEEVDEQDDIYMHLTIPNREVRTIYRNSIKEWFRDEIKATDLSPLRTALETGDCERIGDFLSDRLMKTISYYDYDETYYHGFLAGILTAMDGYEVLSNRESGTGRPDIILKELKFRGRAMILELKATKDIKKLSEACDEALEQIADKSYNQMLEADGYTPILKYGICFFKKGCMVKKAETNI